MTNKEKLVVMVQTMALRGSPTSSSTSDVAAVAMALLAIDEKVPPTFVSAANELFAYVTRPNQLDVMTNRPAWLPPPEKDSV